MERPDAENNDAPLAASDTVILPAPHADLSPDGSSAEGRAVPNATITIYNEAGDVLGTSTSDANGNFTASLFPPQANGERLHAIARDWEGNTSDPGYFWAPDITPPDTPTGTYINDYTSIVGISEPGSTVFVRDQNNQVLGSIIADADGNYTVTVWRIPNIGEEYAIYARDSAGNESLQRGLTRAEDTDPCFLAGTMILTPQGEVAVQDLKIGDFILSREGEAVPVLWIGTRQVRTAQKRSVDLPVCVRAGALGEGLPHSDLRLSPDHAVVLDELLVNAGALRNGETVFSLSMQELGAEFTYYHIETRNHEEILANGLAVETFIDYVSRSAFDNYAEYLELHGADRIIKEMQRPRIASARNLPASLQDRLGLTPSCLEDDVALLLSARAG